MNAPSTKAGPRFPDGRPEAKQPPWRHDFPIDWPQDHYVARRDYAKFLVLTSFGFVVGQFWIGFRSLFRGRGRPPIRRIATLDQLPVGTSLGFNYPGPADPCLLIRPDDRTLLAYNQKCTHLACAVIPQLDRGQLLCPCHQGLFDLSTGRPLAGPPRRPLTRIILEVTNGVVYATGVEERTV